MNSIGNLYTKNNSGDTACILAKFRGV